jgi:hypothetical protein
MLFSQPTVTLDEFESRSGWHLRPEGLCQDDLCIPVGAPLVSAGVIDLRKVAQALNMPVVAGGGLIALGPRANEFVLPHNARAPKVVLLDVHGQPFDLASLLGTKVLLLAWASW